MKILQALAILGFALNSVACLKEDVRDKATGNIIGQQDIIPNGVDGRFTDIAPESTLEITNTKLDTFDLGVEDWGPIQIAMKMTSYPDGAARLTDPQICKILYEEVDLNITTSNYNNLLPSGAEISHIAYFGSLLFCLQSSQGTIHGVEIMQDIITKTRIPILRWTLNIGEMAPSDIPGAKLIADPSNNQVLIFFNNLVAFIDLSTQQGDSKKAPTYTVEGFTFANAGEVRFIDAKDKALTVVTRDSLMLYNISSGTIDSFGRSVIDTKFNQIESFTPDLRDFEVNSGRIEITNLNDTQTLQNTNMYDNVIFNFSVNAWIRESWANFARVSANLIFVADVRKVYIFQYDMLINGVALLDAMIPHSIEITDVISIRRHQESLYLLRTSSSDIGSPALEVVEVFLQANLLSQWTNEATNEADLYVVNNVFVTDFPITDIYVDDLYLYMMGDNKSAVARRGAPQSYTSSQVLNVKGTTGLVLSHVQKILINGEGETVAIQNKQPVLVYANRHPPQLSCPANSTNFNFGDYEIQLNVTSTNCPKKNAVTKFSFNLKSDLNKACLLQKNIKIHYSGTIDLSKVAQQGEPKKSWTDNLEAPSWAWGIICGLLSLVFILLVLILAQGRKAKEAKQYRKTLESEIESTKIRSRRESTDSLKQGESMGVFTDRIPEHKSPESNSMTPEDSPGLRKSPMKRQRSKEFNINVNANPPQ